LGEASAVYGFNSASLELLREARSRGLYCALEQTIAPRAIEQRLMAEERAAWPGWSAAPADASVFEEFAAREAAEWALADTVLCGSSFVAESIAAAGGPAERCHVVPYGVDLAANERAATARNRPLRVLFCGALGLRKGAPYLLEAVRRLRRSLAEVRIVGAMAAPPSIRREFAHLCDLTGPVPRPAVAAHYRWADIFVLPSICEGSATVCYEALAAGLPVITTANAGSVVRNGVEGFIVPIRDAGAIAGAIELLAGDRDLLAVLSASARERARDFTVARYSTRLLAAIDSDFHEPVSAAC
jgi:glycosyltransferase involved in cell wall biosynthesis